MTEQTPSSQPTPAPTRQGNLLPIIGAVVVALVLGFVVGFAAGHADDGASPRKATADASSSGDAGGEDDVSDDYEDELEPQAELSPSDWALKLRVTSKECFGSAGCLVEYEIRPSYIGSVDISEGTWDVTYKVTGGEDGPQVGTFTVEDGSADLNSGDVTTPSSGTKLRARVTEVVSVTY